MSGVLDSGPTFFQPRNLSVKAISYNGRGGGSSSKNFNHIVMYIDFLGLDGADSKSDAIFSIRHNFHKILIRKLCTSCQNF